MNVDIFDRGGVLIALVMRQLSPARPRISRPPSPVNIQNFYKFAIFYTTNFDENNGFSVALEAFSYAIASALSQRSRFIATPFFSL